MLVAAVAARACRLGPLGRRGVTAGAAGGTAFFFVLVDRRSDLGLRRTFGRAASFLLGAETSLFGSFLFRLAILVGAAALIFALRRADAFFAAAGFFGRGEPRFLCFAQELRLKLLAAGDIVLWRRLASGRRGRSWLRRRLWHFGHGLGRRGRRCVARAAEDTALLDLDDDRVRAAVAEALLDLAGLDRALESQRGPGAKLRFFGLVCHSNPSSIRLQPKASPRRVQRLPDHDQGQ